MDATQAKKSFSAGEIIMRQGEKGKCAYIIEEGQVEILLERPDGAQLSVATRGPGSIIGEMAIVDDAPRTATVRAVKDCRMLEISRDDFAQRLKTADPVIQMISQVILTRYRDMLARVEQLGDTTQTTSDAPPPETREQTVAGQSDVLESVRIANMFKEALANKELQLYYQPIIDLQNGHVAGFEALMRWPHPEQGFISPGLFIPIAENSGQIVAASQWALRESCAALQRIENALGQNGRLYMSINFASPDFDEPDFVPNLISALEHHHLQPAQLKLEITERLLIQQPEIAKEKLQACRNLGMGVSIDDFGTGYSSLSYLYYFPIETLKIDQSFIRALEEDERSRELVRSIIGLGRSMGMNVTAEGVEGQNEAAILRDLGCDSAQGYYFARPMPEDKIIAMLSDWQPGQMCTG